MREAGCGFSRQCSGAAAPSASMKSATPETVWPRRSKSCNCRTTWTSQAALLATSFPTTICKLVDRPREARAARWRCGAANPRRASSWRPKPLKYPFPYSRTHLTHRQKIRVLPRAPTPAEAAWARWRIPRFFSTQLAARAPKSARIGCGGRDRPPRLPPA